MEAHQHPAQRLTKPLRRRLEGGGEGSRKRVAMLGRRARRAHDRRAMAVAIVRGSWLDEVDG